MFRCPSCARMHKFPVTKNYSILAGKHMDVFHVVKEPFFKGSVAHALANMHKVESLEEARAFLAERGEEFDEESTCFMCKETNTSEDWIRAHEFPMEFFDAEKLCGCGGELWMDRLPYSNKYGLVCERCEWSMPNYALSGSSDPKVK